MTSQESDVQGFPSLQVIAVPVHAPPPQTSRARSAKAQGNALEEGLNPPKTRVYRIVRFGDPASGSEAVAFSNCQRELSVFRRSRRCAPSRVTDGVDPFPRSLLRRCGGFPRPRS